jgi:hypothetical protein
MLAKVQQTGEFPEFAGSQLIKGKGAWTQVRNEVLVLRVLGQLA